MPVIPSWKPLVRVVRVVDIQPIDNADSIELATVLGYQCCISRRDGFAVGDLVLYCGIDAVLETNPDTAFLDGQRIRIRKMRGVVSEGLIAPLRWVVRYGVEGVSALKEGDDMTERMRVQQWIADEEKVSHAPAGERTSGLLGTTIPKTNQTRIQENPRALRDAQAADETIITLKMDGSSATYAWVNGEFRVFSRNLDITLLTSDKSFAAYHRASAGLAERMAALGREIAVQGELCDPSINGGRTGVVSLQFLVFHVFSVTESQYLPWREVEETARALGLQTVPVLHRGKGLPACAGNTIPALLAWVDTLHYASGLPAEGVVLLSEGGQHRRQSYKAMAPRYLLMIGGGRQRSLKTDTQC